MELKKKIIIRAILLCIIFPLIIGILYKNDNVSENLLNFFAIAFRKQRRYVRDFIKQWIILHRDIARRNGSFTKAVFQFYSGGRDICFKKQS